MNMITPPLPRWMLQRWWRWKRTWQKRRLRDPRWGFLFEPPPHDEWVALDCETTGLNVRRDEIIAIGATRIVGRRIVTSQRLELLVRPEGEVPAASVAAAWSPSSAAASRSKVAMSACAPSLPHKSISHEAPSDTP